MRQGENINNLLGDKHSSKNNPDKARKARLGKALERIKKEEAAIRRASKIDIIALMKITFR